MDQIGSHRASAVVGRDAIDGLRFLWQVEASELFFFCLPTCKHFGGFQMQEAIVGLSCERRVLFTSVYGSEQNDEPIAKLPSSVASM